MIAIKGLRAKHSLLSVLLFSRILPMTSSHLSFVFMVEMVILRKSASYFYISSYSVVVYFTLACSAWTSFSSSLMYEFDLNKAFSGCDLLRYLSRSFDNCWI